MGGTYVLLRRMGVCGGRCVREEVDVLGGQSGWLTYCDVGVGVGVDVRLWSPSEWCVVVL